MPTLFDKFALKSVLQPLRAAVCGLHIGLERAAQQVEILDFRRNARAPWRAGEFLTIGAVADCALRRIDLGFIGDASALTFSIDVHDVSH